MPLSLSNIPSGVRLNLPKLERGGQGYDVDVLNAVGKFFGVTPERGKLLAALSPINSHVLPSAHALSAKAGLGLEAFHFEPNLPDGELLRLQKCQETSHPFSEPLFKRQRDLVQLGKELGVQFFDRNMTLDEIKEMLAKNRVGLIGLDCDELAAAQGMTPDFMPFDAEHLERLRKSSPVIFPPVLVVGYDARSIFLHTYANSFLEIPFDSFEKSRHGNKAYSAVVFISNQCATEIEASVPLPDFIKRGSGQYLNTVFDHGNAHFSKTCATRFAIHRANLTSYKSALAAGNFDQVNHALGQPFDGLHNIILSMYIPGLMSNEYRAFTGNEKIGERLEELESIRLTLRDFVWRTQRTDNANQVPITLDQLEKFGLAVEYLAEGLERLIPQVILKRYLNDTDSEISGYIRDKPKSEHVPYWKSILNDLALARVRFEERVAREHSAAAAQDIVIPNLDSLSGGDGDLHPELTN